MLILILLTAIYQVVVADLLSPSIYSNLGIKPTQLLGIIIGCIVFSITVATVLLLLIYSGTFNRFVAEVQSGAPLNIAQANKSQYLQTVPELYDHLIEATKSLPNKPSPPLMKAIDIIVRPLIEEDISVLFDASNGSPQYHESAYDPEIIWGWLEIENTVLGRVKNKSESGNDSSHELKPYTSYETFKKWLTSVQSLPNTALLTIIDCELRKQIGLVYLSNNRPRDLSIQIEYFWVTPAYQRKNIGQKTMLLLLHWLFEIGYRRVTVEADNRQILLKKFLTKCGFSLEAILRKHKIVLKRNRDTAVYVILNSEWPEEEFKMKKKFGLKL